MKQYTITEAQKIEMINFLDRIAGTRPIANFLEALPQTDQPVGCEAKIETKKSKKD